MSSASLTLAKAGGVLTWSPPRRDGSLLAAVLVPGEGRFLGSEFDSTPRLRHFPEETRHATKSVRMSEMWYVVRVGLVVDGGWRGGRTYGDSRGATRSPWAAPRSRVWPAVKKRSWGWRQASTSAQVTGVETVGNWRARSE